MKFKVGRYGIEITPEGEQDQAYIEEVLRLRRKGDRCAAVRVATLGIDTALAFVEVVPMKDDAVQSAQNVAQAEAHAAEENIRGWLDKERAAAVARAEKAERERDEALKRADAAEAALKQKIDSAYAVFQRANAAEADVARLKAQIAHRDPRREVGAVVLSGGTEFVVLHSGATDCQRRATEGPDWPTCGFRADEDKFHRWATPEECARHGIAYVDRTTRVQQTVGGVPVVIDETVPVGHGLLVTAPAAPDLDALRAAVVDALAQDDAAGVGNREAWPRRLAASRALAAALKAGGGAK